MAGIDLAALAGRQQRAELVHAASAYGIADDDALGDGMLREMIGREDLHPACPDIVLADHTLPPAEMIRMRVREDDRNNRLAGTVLVIEFHACFRGLGRKQRIDDDQAGVGFHDRHVRVVEAPDLVHAVGHLEETMEIVELRLTPQARIDGGGRRGQVPGHLQQLLAGRRL